MTSSSQPAGKFQVTDLHCDKSSMCGFHSLSSHCPCSGMSAFIKLNILPCLIFWVQSLHTFCGLLLSHWIRLLDRCTCQPKKETACLPFIFSVCEYSKRFERNKWVSPILTYLIVKADLSAHKHSILDLVGVTLSPWHIGIHGAFTQSTSLSNNPKILDNYYFLAVIHRCIICIISSPRGSWRSQLTLVSPIYKFAWNKMWE